MHSWQRIAFALFTAVSASPARKQLAAQASAPPHRTSTWAVARDPFVDLWFHCLALAGYEGYGPLSLYDQRYAARIREQKQRAHVTTMLDARGSELGAAFARDSAFEVLHFVPLYFLGRDPRLALSELRRAVESPAAASEPARLIAATLATPRERAVLLSFIDAADEEWTAFLRAEWAARAESDRRAVRELLAAWNDRFAPLLDGYLGATKLERGVVIVSPAVGGDGRFVRATGGLTVVVVSSDRSDVAYAPLLAAVGELAYPLLDELRSPLTPATSRVSAARARDAAAVRAGALLLDAVDSRLAAEYRRHFLGLTTSRSFDSAFPIDRGAESELRHLIAATLRTVAARNTRYENP